MTQALKIEKKTQYENKNSTSWSLLYVWNNGFSQTITIQSISRRINELWIDRVKLRQQRPHDRSRRGWPPWLSRLFGMAECSFGIAHKNNQATVHNSFPEGALCGKGRPPSARPDVNVTLTLIPKGLTPSATAWWHSLSHSNFLLWLSCLWPDVRGVLTVRRVVASLLCSFTTQKEIDSPDNSGLHAEPPRHCWPWPQTDQVGFET